MGALLKHQERGHCHPGGDNVKVLRGTSSCSIPFPSQQSKHIFYGTARISKGKVLTAGTATPRAGAAPQCQELLSVQ